MAQPRTLLCPCLALLVLCSLTSAFAGPVGWRTDGTGKYPGATPPLEWGPGKNIVWSAAIPTTSKLFSGNSTPVLVGDRLFICSEPDNLLCYNTADGALLWQRSNGYKDIATPEEAADLDSVNAQVADLRKQQGQAQGRIYQARQGLQDKPDDAALKEQLAAAQQQVKDLQAQLGPLSEKWYVLPRTYAINGYSTATPVSDGRYVYALFGHGVAACYDLEGNLVWRRFLERPVNEYGHSASPVLADGKLIVHVLHLTALDPATGKELWKVRLPESWGTPQVGRVGDTEIIATPAGDIVRARDGMVLAKDLYRLDYSDPILDGDKLYLLQHEKKELAGKAYRLPATIDEGNFKPTELWTTEVRHDRYYAAKVLHEGIIYCCTQGGVFSAVDAANGKVIYEQTLGGKPAFYPAVTLAGGYLFASSERGTIFVIKAGRTFELVGQNELEPFRACPVFSGNKLYLRGLKTLYCIGPK